MAVEFEITDNQIEEVLAHLEQAKKRALTKIGIKVEKYAKALCPVGTPESVGTRNKKTGKVYPKKGYRGGTLRNSITYEVSGNDLTVGSNVEYAPYVELGTGHHFTPPPDWEQFTTKKGSGIGHGYVRPRKFLQPAIIDHMNQYRQIIEDEMTNGL